MPIIWLKGALLTQKILIIQILGKVMKRMIDGIWSLSMKWIIAFAMKSTCQFLFVSPGDLMMDSVFKEFSESYNQANKNWGEMASEEVTKVVLVAFKETLS